MPATSTVPAARRRKAERLVAAAEATDSHAALVDDLNGPENWRYYDGTREWINVITGEVRQKAPPGACRELPMPLPNHDAPTIDENTDEEVPFGLSPAQISAGISLAIDERTGEIRRCPECGRHRLVSMIRDGRRWIICADSLSVEPSCNYYRTQPNKR